MADNGDTTQPGRRFGQAIDLHIANEGGGIAHMVGQVETQPYQRQGHNQHPQYREHTGGQGFAAVEQARQQAHQRPAGKRQDRAPEQR
ncbi:hypothetical protein D9M71_438740 [compost metagenome]